MSNYVVTDAELTYEANKIRGKLGNSDPITFVSGKGFGDTIDSISTGGGGITPTGTKQINISTNGTTTEDVTTYANVEVTVAVQPPSGSIRISTNGTYDVTNYSEAVVAVPASGMIFSKVTQAILLKNARSSGNITFNRLSYNANTIMGWGGQSTFAVGNTNNFSDYVTDGTHIWFRAQNASTVKYNGANATFTRDTSSSVIMLTIPDNYDNTIPFELS